MSIQCAEQVARNDPTSVCYKYNGVMGHIVIKDLSFSHNFFSNMILCRYVCFTYSYKLHDLCLFYVSK